MRSRSVWVGMLPVVLLAAGLADRLKAEDAVFPLAEVSVFDSDALGSSASELSDGARATTQDEPFVWDFSAPPDVMFASPARDQTYKPGDAISVQAVLIDPTLNAMIRGLNDVDRTEKKTILLSEGRTTTIEQQVSLDPTVTITNSSGKQVAEGPMPFG